MFVFFFFKILIQGCLVTEENINFVLETVHKQLMEQEDYLAKTTSMPYCDTCSSDEVGSVGIRENKMLGNNLAVDWHGIQGGVFILLSCLIHAMEIWISLA